MVSRKIDLTDLTPAELAELFCDLLSDGQAEFFNEVGAIAKAWPGAGWCQQSCSIVRAPELNDVGRQTIASLADHLALRNEEAA